MKVVILAGGYGTRISEETHLKPKPMIEIGGKPILWHILKMYSFYGLHEFIICCGYKGYVIKEYFANYFLHNSDITFHMDLDNKVEFHNKKSEHWKITLVDTGDKTQTGGRLGRVASFLKDEAFCFTYGDGLSDVNINDLINFHHKNKGDATLTAVQPPGRFGALIIEDNFVSRFQEKPLGDNSWINGGFFVLNSNILNRVIGDEISWEQDVLPILAKERKLSSFKHSGFWHPMDTLRDKRYLDNLWLEKKAPWKTW